MAGVIGQGVSLEGIPQDEFNYTFNLASSITVADIGKAVSIDTSAANTVKLAADGDRILGQLSTFEDRTTEGIKIGGVSTKGGKNSPKVTRQ